MTKDYNDKVNSVLKELLEHSDIDINLNFINPEATHSISDYLLSLKNSGSVINIVIREILNTNQIRVAGILSREENIEFSISNYNFLSMFYPKLPITSFDYILKKEEIFNPFNFLVEYESEIYEILEVIKNDYREYFLSFLFTNNDEVKSYFSSIRNRELSVTDFLDFMTLNYKT